MPNDEPDEPIVISGLRLDILEGTFSYYIRALDMAVSKDLDRRMGGLEVARGKGKITTLLLVDGYPEIRPSTIAEVLMRDRPSTGRTIDTLVARGLIERTIAADDQRAQSLTITPRGRELAKRVRRIVRQQEEEFFDFIAPEDRTQFMRLLGHPLALLGAAMVLVLTFACFAGPYLLPYDELYIDLRARFAPPGTGGHIFGTDPLGRDIAARLFHAGQVSMGVGFAAMLISTCTGSAVGVVSGYYGGKVGAVLMRVVDAFLSFPSVFLLLVLAAFTKPGPAMITLIIAVTSWMEVARIVEAEVKSLRDRDFVQAARMLGLSSRWIMLRELLPNAVGPIIVAATLTVARAILLEAYISFLGYGIQPPLPSWGNMLNGAQQYLQSAPWLAIIPGAAITIAVTGFNFVGDGLRDALDSRSDMR